MRLAPTRALGVIGYPCGVLLIALPSPLGLADGACTQWLPVVRGLGVLVHGPLTDYELGAVRLIRMPAHRALEGLGGVFFAVSPGLFGLGGQLWLSFLVIGAFELMMSVITARAPADGPGSLRGLV